MWASKQYTFYVHSSRASLCMQASVRRQCMVSATSSKQAGAHIITRLRANVATYVRYFLRAIMPRAALEARRRALSAVASARHSTSVCMTSVTPVAHASKNGALPVWVCTSRFARRLTIELTISALAKVASRPAHLFAESQEVESLAESQMCDC